MCRKIYCYFFLILFYTTASAQAPSQATAKVYLDCNSCPDNYIRQNIDFVSFVRDRQVADIHLLITRQFIASGGREYLLRFIGLTDDYPLDYDLEVVTYRTDSELSANRKLTQTIRAGLLPYVINRTPLNLVAEREETEEGPPRPTIADDPWDFWLFEIAASLDWERESNQRDYDMEGEIDIRRVTHRWRIRNEGYIDYEVTQVRQDSQSLTSSLRRLGLESSAVKSLNSHWSTGAFVRLFSNTYNNIQRGLRLQGALEYNVFPYRLSATKEFTFAYLVGPRYFDYLEPTIFEQLQETRVAQSLRVNFELRKVWGAFDARLEGSHFFYDFGKNRLELDTRASLRVFKGLFVRIGAEADLVNDQIFLPQGDASLEEVLLQRKALATSFRFELRFGIVYTFGSIYNSIVNNRL